MKRVQSFFSLMLQNLMKNSILDFCYTGLYAGWSVREKQLITYFVKHFTEKVMQMLYASIFKFIIQN